MKPPHITISALLFAAAVAPAAERSIDPTAPQPRVRLHQTPSGTVAQKEAIKAPTQPVMLQKFEVSKTKLPQRPSDEAPSDPVAFSIAGGGTFFTDNIGGAPFALGLWPRYDLFWKDSRFKPQKTRVDIEVVRIKL